MAEGGNMLRITRAEQAVKRAKDTDQNAINNNDNEANNK
jgi:hypothetical protein